MRNDLISRSAPRPNAGRSAPRAILSVQELEPRRVLSGVGLSITLPIVPPRPGVELSAIVQVRLAPTSGRVSVSTTVEVPPAIPAPLPEIVLPSVAPPETPLTIPPTPTSEPASLTAAPTPNVSARPIDLVRVSPAPEVALLEVRPQPAQAVPASASIGFVAPAPVVLAPVAPPMTMPTRVAAPVAEREPFLPQVELPALHGIALTASESGTDEPIAETPEEPVPELLPVPIPGDEAVSVAEPIQEAEPARVPVDPLSVFASLNLAELPQTVRAALAGVVPSDAGSAWLAALAVLSTAYLLFEARKSLTVGDLSAPVNVPEPM